MSDISFLFSDKFPPVVVQGAILLPLPPIVLPIRFTASGKTAWAIFSMISIYRITIMPVTGLKYLAKGVYSTKYNVSWVALNDVQTTPLWQQKLSIDSVGNTTYLPYVTVGYNVFSEITLGQWTLPNYRNVPLYVIGLLRLVFRRRQFHFA